MGEPVAASRKAGRSAGMTPSRRSPRSTMTTMPCPPRRARGGIQRPGRHQLAGERDVGQTHRVGRLRRRRRAQQPQRGRDAGRAAREVPSRESPSARAPPASSARPTSGLPHVTFVTATTSSQMATPTVLALSSILPRSMVQGRACGCRCWTMHIPYATRYGRTRITSKRRCRRQASGVRVKARATSRRRWRA